MRELPCIVLSTGEPAGIGPDVVLDAARSEWPARIVAVGDAQLLAQRQRMLGVDVQFRQIGSLQDAPAHRAGSLAMLHVPLEVAATPGRLASGNAAYVLRVLDLCVDACLQGNASAMVTAPVHKGIINDAGIAFSGHTEYLAQRSGVELPVMLLCAGELRVALATTHLSIRAVSDAITPALLHNVAKVLDADLRTRFAIDSPVIGVCGLNPHAGEGGYLGREEIDTIEPTLEQLRAEGLQLLGPLPADTAFTPRVLEQVHAVLAMYHDQGLPVLKYAGFGDAVNVTLGLPFVRTSVDHGTALDLAGSGAANAGSLHAAISLALDLAAA